jgi:hypothetical protein
MLEQGLVMLINTSLNFIGGFANQLPSNATLPNYTFLTIHERTIAGLQVPGGMAQRRMEFNCFGTTQATAFDLADRISAVLMGYRGILTDPDATQVDSIFPSDMIDFEQDPAARNYRRLIEFYVNYYPTFPLPSQRPIQGV